MATTKRNDGEGTYSKQPDSDGNWIWTLSIGPRGDVTRIVRKDKTKSGLKDKVRKALKELDESGARLPKGQKPRVRNKTFELIQRIERQMGQRKRREHTQAKYRSLIDIHINPILGSHYAHQVTWKEIQRLVDTVLATPRKKADGTPLQDAEGNIRYLSGDTALAVANCACTALGLSVRQLVKDGLEMPQAKRRERVLLEETEAGVDEVEKLLDELFRQKELKHGGHKGEVRYVHRDRFAIALLLNTGLRVSELLGIEIFRINKRERTLDVAKQLSRPKGKGSNPSDWTLDDLKTDGSARVLPLNDEAMAIIEGQLKMIAEERNLAGDAYDDNGLLFPTSTGRPHRDRNVLRTLENICEAIGIDHTTNHDLRRTYITHLAATEPILARIMALSGHTKVETLHNHYIKLAKSKVLRETADKVSFGVKKQA